MNETIEIEDLNQSQDFEKFFHFNINQIMPQFEFLTGLVVGFGVLIVIKFAIKTWKKFSN